MKKIVICLVLVLLVLTGCAINYNKNNNQTDTNKVVTPDQSSGQTEEQKKSTNDSKLSDKTVFYKEAFATDYVFRDALSSVTYLVITDTEIILINQTEEHDFKTTLNRNYLSSVETINLGTFTTFTFVVMGVSQNRSFSASSSDSIIINNLLNN